MFSAALTTNPDAKDTQILSRLNLTTDTGYDFDEIDAELDRYLEYEEQFTQHQRRQKNNASAKEKKAQQASRAQISTVAEAEGLEGGFKTTYKPGLFEEGWLLDSLRPFYDMGLMTDVLGRVKGGKEANVYRVEGSDNLGGGLWAAKVYRPQMFRTMKNDSTYREGRSTLNSEGHVIKQQASNRVMRAVAKKSSFGREVSHGSWLMHEYGTMQKLHKAGAAVPKPVASAGNSILMGYYGDETLAAPLLSEIRLDEDQAREAFDTVLNTVQIMLSFGMVHGDLSPYNVLYWEDQAVVIDFPQVIEVDGNPNARQFLTRDLTRLCDYFADCGDERDPDALVRELWVEIR
jgi:RIO kinase 1